jgi:hypothetical protein
VYSSYSVFCGKPCVPESDSDSEDTDGVYYSVYEHRQRHKRKQQLEGSGHLGQSTMTVTLSISQGVINLYAPVRVRITCTSIPEQSWTKKCRLGHYMMKNFVIYIGCLLMVG